MLRIIIAAAAMVLAAECRSEEPGEEWIKFLKGKWTCVSDGQPGDYRGKWKPRPDGYHKEFHVAPSGLKGVDRARAYAWSLDDNWMWGLQSDRGQLVGETYLFDGLFIWNMAFVLTPESSELAKGDVAFVVYAIGGRREQRIGSVLLKRVSSNEFRCTIDVDTDYETISQLLKNTTAARCFDSEKRTMTFSRHKEAKK